MPNTSTNVTSAKPKIGGALYVAPLGTAIPTDTATELDSAFKCLGYISEDGITDSISQSTAEVKAWGGDSVLSEKTDTSEHFKTKLLEVLNEDVLKFVFGADNVSGTLASGLAVKHNSKDVPAVIIVTDCILKNNIAMRKVCPNAQMTSLGDIVLKGGEAMSFDVDLACLPDTNGNTVYDYYKSPTTEPDDDDEP